MNKYFIGVECKCGCNDEVVFASETVDGVVKVSSYLGATKDLWDSLDKATDALNQLKIDALNDGIPLGKATIYKVTEVAVFTQPYTPPNSDDQA